MTNCMDFPDTVEEFMERNKTVDTDHVYSNGIEFVPIFRMKQWFQHLNSTMTEHRMTNAMKIRLMTDDELAEFLTCDFCKLLNCESPCDGRCDTRFLEWLKREVECTTN